MNIGTPFVPLHVKSGNDNGAIFAEHTSAVTQFRTMFGIINKGPSSLTIVDTAPGGEDWFFRGSTSGPFAIDAFSTATTTEMFIAPGGTLTIAGSLIQGSSADIKHDVVEVDPVAVLAGVRSLDISAWSYDAEPGVRHMGPMSEDFSAMFGLGANRAGIAAVDADGVALAAIQALAAENEALVRRNAELAAHVGELDARLAALEAARPAG